MFFITSIYHDNRSVDTYAARIKKVAAQAICRRIIFRHIIGRSIKKLDYIRYNYLI